MSNMTTGTSATSGTQSAMPTGMNPATSTSVPRHRVRRLSTETKAAFKTTELLAYLGTVIAIAIAAQTIGSDTGAGDGDYFRADKAFMLIVITTVGYLVSRGLAKSGSRDFYDDDVD